MFSVCRALSLTLVPPTRPHVPFPISYLSINYPICKYILKLKRREFKAVVLMSSQKTLPVSVTVIGFLGDVGAEGLMTIPCIIGHMSQLFIDAYIASRWANDDVAAVEDAAGGAKKNGVVSTI